MEFTQYIYSPDQAGIEKWPEGTLRLEGIPVVENPTDATVFTVPGNIRIFETTPGSGILDHAKLYRLPYLKGNESRTVFFDCSDDFKTPVSLPILFIKCDARTWMLPHDTGTIQVGWPVDDISSECMEVPPSGFKYSVSFHGWNSSEARTASVTACANDTRFESDLKMYPDFYGYLHATPEGKRRRIEFLRSLKESRIILAPESIPGVLPYRFLESLSAGRVPLLVSSDYILPFHSQIDYESFCIFCPRDEAHRANEYAFDFLSKTSDAEIIEKGRLARKAWLEFLDSRRWPEIMAKAVIAKLGVLQAA